MLKEEIFISIYGPDVALAKDVDFMKSVPIFSVLSQMEAQVKDLREQSSALRAQLDDKEAEIASMMQISGSVASRPMNHLSPFPGCSLIPKRAFMRLMAQRSL